ncbi:peptide-methionine (S)-S-oxide reductase [Mucilaginibacter pedocola]|uniref:peptide-methionine (S)-S-oxide reductase n=1 Tax=Mucilaginibacter pedocola TaxID=1792845 RepID=A0A1S9PJS2_9SPHI|nr:peptide-methionine (S)-S-oxide reductase [Mucilaginibacter pedocola]OOQ61200.1 peptide methionine sulfoxide reductase [Mucilaginibacter pedocola]
MQQIGFGGSCHWCTEAIFLSLKGVGQVLQGWIASDGDNTSFSEAVIVEFDVEVISLETLIAVHLYTHSCTSTHSMRGKYRSAVYIFGEGQAAQAEAAILKLQSDFDEPIITQVLPFKEFKPNKEEYLDYYYSNPDKPFCQNIVNPKLRVLLERFGDSVDSERLNHLGR